MKTQLKNALKYSPFIVLTLVNLASVWARADGRSQATVSHATDTTNPFNEGNVAVKLTPDQIADLTAYINRSAEGLTQALDDAKGLGLTESSRVYLNAVKEVVLSSSANANKARTELLMREILNQALALTYGIPNADGNGLEQNGVLSQASYRELLRIILRQSIELALQYVDQDRAASQAGSLIDLPYAELAYKRMQMSQQWMRSILEQELSARFGIASLQQWLNLMAAQDQQHQTLYASAIKLVNDAIDQENQIGKDKSLAPNIKAGEQERVARIAMNRVTEKMKKDLSSPVVSLPVPGLNAIAEGAQTPRGIWLRITNQSIHRIQVMPDGRVYGVGDDGSVWVANVGPGTHATTAPIEGCQSDGVCGAWTRVAGPSVQDIQVVGDSIYGIGQDLAVYQISTSGSGNWTRITDPAVTQIQVTANGDIYGLGQDGVIYLTRSGRAWSQVLGGSVTRFQMTADGTFYGLSKAGKVYKGVNGQWTQIVDDDGTVVQIQVMANGDIYALADQGIFVTREGGQWAQIGGTFGAVQMQVMPNGDIYTVGSKDNSVWVSYAKTE